MAPTRLSSLDHALPAASCALDVIRLQAERRPDASAIVAPDRAPLSYAALVAAIERMAAVLRTQGVSPGTRIALVLPPGPDTMIVLLATGAVAAAAPLSPTAPEAELARAFADMRVDAVIAAGTGPARRAAERLSLPLLELAGPPRFGAASAWAAPGDETLLLQTSGTTAASKTVPLTHVNLCTAAVATAAALEIGPGDRCLNLLPLHHLSGCAFGTLTSLVAGATVIAPPAAFDAIAFFELLARFDPTWFAATPTMLAAIVARLRNESLQLPRGALRFIRSGAAALPPQLLRDVEDAFGVPVVEAYSLSEAPGVATNRPASRVAGSVGTSLGPEIAIVDANRVPLAPGRTGNVLVRGASVMRDPSPDGWLDTGDVGYLDATGVLFLTGRAKEMINRGGESVAPREIEEVLLDLAGVRDVAAFAVPDARLGEDIGVAIVPAEPAQLTAEAVRDFVAARLSAHKVPRLVVFLPELPKNANGKVLRRALQSANRCAAEPVAAARSGPPVTPNEELVARLWRELLGVAEVRCESNFFDLGGDSLTAARLVARLREQLGVEVALHHVFIDPTVAGIAAQIETLAPATLTRIARAANDGPVALSSQQRRMWFVHQLATDKSAFNLHRAIRIAGPLDVERLRAAIAAVAGRHELLRARFSNRSGTPAYAIDAAAHETRYREPAGGETLASIAAAEAALPFDLETQAPFRSTIVHLGPDDHALLLTLHHIAADGWALAILLRDIGATYRGVRSAEPPLRYSDFARWQERQQDGPAARAAFDYWSAALAGELPPAEFPADRRHAGDEHTVATRRLHLGPETVGALRALGRHAGASLFMVLFGLYDVLLSRYSGQRDVIVGVPTAGRSTPELEAVIGMFVSALPLRVATDPELSFRELLGRVRDAFLAAQQHQEIPYEPLIDALRPPRSTNGSPFFRTLFSLQNMPHDDLELGLETNVVARSTAASGLDFNFIAYESGDAVDCVVEFHTPRYDAATVEQILAHYANLARAVVADDQQPVGRLPLLAPDERRTLLETWNSTTRPLPRDARLHALFRERARSAPERIALVDGAVALTYGELDERSDRLAAYLRANGLERGHCVGLCLQRSAGTIVATVAVLKAGGACVPLDPASPAERLRTIVTKAAPALILAETATRAALGTLDARVVELDRERAAWDRALTAPLADLGQAGDLAYVLFTSGSTGEPQGVMLEHRGFANYVVSAAMYAIRPQDRVLQFMSLGFDVSVGEIWGALCSGATLCLRDDEMIATPARFVERSRELGITVWVLPTVYFHELAAALSAAPLALPPSLRLVAFAGEAVRADLVAAWLRTYGDAVEVLNHYGPTEASIAVTSYDCRAFAPDDEAVPIGTPIANMRCYVLDANREPAPLGVTGELYLAGVGVARGYMNDPDRTEQRFLPDPFHAGASERMYKTGDLARYRRDGEIVFAGRTDHQVKIRGFRVEPAEVEAAIVRHPAVHECVVRVDERGGEKRLVAFVTTHSGAPLAPLELRRFLSGTLPPYMLPAETVALDAFPLTSSGKLDRRALVIPEPGAATSATGQPAGGPQNILEVALVDVFREVLGVPAFGVEDDFFEFGGHSLQAARLVSRIEAECCERVAMKSLFEAPTPRRLAAQIIDAERPATVLTKIQDGTKPVPLFFLCGDLSGSGAYVRRLARSLDPELTVYVLPPHGTNGTALLDTPQAMAADYAALIHAARPNGPYLVGGYCNGGIVAYEVARLLRAEAEVGPVVLIASGGFNSVFRRLEAFVRWAGRLARWSPATERQWFRRLRRRALDLRTLRAAAPGTWLQYAFAQLRGLVRPSTPDVPAVTALPSDVDARLDAYLRIMESYVPDRYDGEVHLFWGNEDRPLLPGDPTRGWGAVARDLAVHAVSGDHTTVVTRSSDEIASVMRTILAAWTEPGGVSSPKAPGMIPEHVARLGDEYAATK